MLQIDNWEPGSDLTVMNVIYRRPMKDEDTGRWSDDYAIIIYKDNNTGKKYSHTIYNPTYTWYLLKPEYQISKNEHFMDINKLTPITCPYTQIARSIAEHTGNMDLFKENIRSGNPYLNKLFFTHPRSFGADVPIKNYIRTEFAATYKNSINEIDIAFFDIESDIIDAKSDDVVIGECPVNLISMFFTKTKTMYTMILRNSKNPQIAELEHRLSTEFDKVKAEYDDYVAKQLGDRLDKYEFRNTELSVAFFDTEESMIVTFFKLLNDLSPDIVTGWNDIWYDFRHLIARLQVKGIDANAAVCDPTVYPKVCNIEVDERHIDKFEERVDIVDIAVKYVVVDSMVIYASRRKGQKAIESFALDFIGGVECNVHKFDYHDITTNIARFPWMNFYLFWIYNMLDVIVVACIEKQTEDIKSMFSNVIEMNTTYEKIYRQTVFLATKAYEFYKSEGVMIQNNCNKFGEKPSKKFPGAFVASPKLISDKNKVKIGNLYISKYNNANDFDYKALYPSLLRWFNMAPHTLIGMVQIEDAPFKDPDFLMIDPGGTYIENLGSYNFIEFCHRWMNLGDITETLDDIKEYFSKYRTPIYKGEGNLELDKTRKVVAYHMDKSKVVSYEKPMPEWVKKEVDNIRERIVLE